MDAVNAAKKDDHPTAVGVVTARELVAAAGRESVSLTGPGGLLKAFNKTVPETALEEEMAEHVATTSMIRLPATAVILGTSIG